MCVWSATSLFRCLRCAGSCRLFERSLHCKNGGWIQCLYAYWLSIDALICLKQTGSTFGSKSMTSCLPPECVCDLRLFRCLRSADCRCPFDPFKYSKNGGWIRCLATRWLSIDALIYLKQTGLTFRSKSLMSYLPPVWVWPPKSMSL